MDTNQIAVSYKRICELKSKIKSLQEARQAEEAALSVRYKENEFRLVRDKVANNYITQITDLNNQIGAIEQILGDDKV